MSEATVTIIVAIIGFLGTLVSVIVSSKNVKDGVTSTLNTEMAVIKTRMDAMDIKITEHNGYARLFNENIPLITYRLSQLEQHKDENKQT